MGCFLRRGDRGEKVKKIQRRLQELGFYRGRISGDYGPITEAAVRAYQRAKGLIVDGCIGNQTWGSLFPADASKSNISIFDGTAAGDVTQNVEIRNNIPRTDIFNEIFEKQKQGSTIIQFGNGNGPKILIAACIHGNEEEAGIATMKYIEYLQNKTVNGTIYIIPFVIPQTVAVNKRNWGRYDPNRVVNRPNTPGNKVINFARDNKLNHILDVHSGGGLAHAKNGLIFVTRGRKADNDWAQFIRGQTGCAVEPGGIHRGMVRGYSHNYGINTLTLEVERDTGSTAHWSNVMFKMIKASVKHLFPTL